MKEILTENGFNKNVIFFFWRTLKTLQERKPLKPFRYKRFLKLSKRRCPQRQAVIGWRLSRFISRSGRKSFNMSVLGIYWLFTFWRLRLLWLLWVICVGGLCRFACKWNESTGHIFLTNNKSTESGSLVGIVSCIYNAILHSVALHIIIFRYANADVSMAVLRSGKDLNPVSFLAHIYELHAFLFAKDYQIFMIFLFDLRRKASTLYKE